MSVGVLGDVKYSILGLDQFKELNGDGWVLMQGQNISGSKLFDLTGIDELPDGRGIFIRGMNLGRSRDDGDVDGDRGVGTFQEDLLGKHTHTGNMENGAEPLNSPSQSSRAAGGHGARSNVQETWTSPALVNSYGGEETRPRNIALFTYIKINLDTD